MIRKITVTNYIGDSIELELTRPDLSGFAIKSIEGLGPVGSNINTTEVATNDGGIFNSARLKQRNILMTLSFFETMGESIEDIRQKSYKYFPEKKPLTFLVETDNRILKTEGYVEKNTPAIFSKSSGCVVSIICPDPHWYSAGDDGNHRVVFDGIEAAFEFPFSNESLTEPLLEFGIIRHMSEQNVPYYGDSEIGVTITIHTLGPVSNITIYNTGTRERMAIDTDKLENLTGSGLVAGDTIIINTRKGHKGIILLRNGVETNILNCLRKGCDWFTLSKGDNIFAYAVESGNENVQFRIDNLTVYSGV